MKEAGISTPREVERTGDDTPAGSVWGYVRRMSGWHQVGVCLIAILAAVINLVPVELQRRIVDDGIAAGAPETLLLLGGIYLGTLLTLQVVKFGLGIYQGWLAESAIAYTRRHLLSLHEARESEHDSGGKAVQITGAEVDKLGGFVGSGPSQAARNGALLAGAIVYMLVIEPEIALLGLALLVPQVVVTPLMQRRLNRLVGIRLELLRRLGDRVSEGCGSEAPEIGSVFRNRMKFFVWKFGLKALLNLLNGLAPLGVLIWGGLMAIDGETTVGVLVAFLAAFERMSGPIRQLIAFYRQAAQAEVQHRMIARWM